MVPIRRKFRICLHNLGTDRTDPPSQRQLGATQAGVSAASLPQAAGYGTLEAIDVQTNSRGSTITAIRELVTELLLAVQILGGYGPPAEAPEVSFVSHDWLEIQACTGPCQVYGWFPPGSTIYLDEQLAPLKDMVARGILVHEIVHYLQNESGRFAGSDTCERFERQEFEAYRIQYRWYFDNRVRAGGLPSFGPPPWSAKRCRSQAENGLATNLPH